MAALLINAAELTVRLEAITVLAAVGYKLLSFRFFQFRLPG